MLPSLITGAVLAVTTMAVLSATKLIFVGLGYPLKPKAEEMIT